MRGILKKGIGQRSVSLLMTLLMVLNMALSPTLPAYAATSEHADCITIQVQDGEGNAVEGATISYKVAKKEDVSTGDAEETIVKETTEATDSYGVVKVLSSSEYEKDLTISATISKDGYKEATISTQDITSDTQNFSVTLEPAISFFTSEITLTVNGHNSTYDGVEHDAISIDGLQSGDTVTCTCDETGESTEFTYAGATSIKIPKIKDVGEYKIQLKVERNGATFESTYQATISKADINRENIKVISYNNLIYNENVQDLIEKIEGIENGDKVSFSISRDDGTGNVADNSTWNDWTDTNKPQATNAGTYTVRIKVDRANYNTVELDPVQVIISQAKLNLTVTSYEGTYDEVEHNAISSIEGLQSGDKVTYTYNGTNTEFTYIDDTSINMPKIKDVGDYKIQLKVERDSNYEIFTEDCTAKINPVEIEGIIASLNTDLTYNGTLQDLVKEISGTVDGDTVSFSLDNGATWTDWTDTQKPQAQDAGTYTVRLKVKRNANYVETEIELDPAEVTISPAEQQIKFNQEHVSSIDFDFNDKVNFQPMDFSVTGSLLTSPVITYEIVNADTEDSTPIDNIAKIDADGKLTIEQGGYNIIVTAKVEGDNNYKEASISHNLTIKETSKDLITFSESSIEFTVGASETISEQVVNLKYNDDNGQITYSGKIKNLTKELSEIGIEIDSDPNSASFGKVSVSNIKDLINAIVEAGGPLSITISAEKAEGTKDVAWGEEDESITTTVFASCIAEYTITISTEAIPSSPYTMQDKEGNTITEANGTNGWYNTEITIIPAEGYSIAKDSDSTDLTYSDSVIFGETVNGEAQDQGEKENIIYLKNETTGGITEPIKIAVDKLDNVSPYNLQVEFPETEEVDETKYYKDKIDIVLSVYDDTSGVDKFIWSYTRSDDASDSILAEDSGEITAKQDENDPTKYIAVLTLPRNEVEKLRGTLEVSAVDKAGNESEKTKTEVIVVDAVSPTMLVEYAPYNNVIGEKYYYNKDIKIKFTITEDNFYEKDVEVKLFKDDDTETTIFPTWEPSETKINGIDTYIGTYIIEALKDNSNDGVYQFKLNYQDRSKNEKIEYTSRILVMDTKLPEIKFNYDTVSQEATIKITEHNFHEDYIKVITEAKNINGNDVTANDLQDYLRNDCEWTSNETDIYEATISEEFVDAIYKLTIDYNDLAFNNATQLTPDEFTVDRTAPERKEIKYSEPLTKNIDGSITYGYYNSAKPVTIYFTAYDVTTGVDYFVLEYQRENGINTNNVETYISKKLEVTQDTTDKSKYTASITLPEDQAKQLRGNISFTAFDKYENKSEKLTDENYIIVVDSTSPTMEDNYTPGNDHAEKTYYSSAITAEFTITETNFDETDAVVTLLKDGGPEITITPKWTSTSTDIHVGTYTIEALDDQSNDGEYQFKLSYTDKSENEKIEYTSGVLVMDTKKPVIKFEYADYSNEKHPQTATITITEHNFYPGYIKVGTKANAITDDIIIANDLQEYLRNCEWTLEEEDVYKATISKEFVDAIYQLTIDFEDLALKKADQLVTDSFIVDHTAPEGMSVEYSPSLKPIGSSSIYNYYNPTVTITFKAYDMTSGVEYFTWEYLKEEGASTSNVEKYEKQTLKAVQNETDKSMFTAFVTLPKEKADQLRGNISFTATDKFKNTSEVLTDNDRIIVVDKISPEMTVEYTNADNKANGNYYYNNDITATFTVNEANFYKEDIVVKLSKNGAEAVVVTPTWTDVSTDIHVGTYTIKAPQDHTNDGDYIFTVTYTDRSNNKMKEYTSDTLVLDTITPIIEFNYADFSNTESPQTATITITEHNFRKSDIEVVTSAKDITDKAVSTNDLQEYLRNCTWTSKGDVHTATISEQFADAIYGLTLNYKDLTLNPAEQVVTSSFIVDHTAPAKETMSITYSESLKDVILSGITFGYYNPTVKITFTAHDMTSGVDYFTWGYTRANDASTSNVEKYVNQRLTAVQDSSDKTKFTASVTLPKEEAEQLRGNIAFTATDKFANESVKLSDDNHVIIVDTISPTMTVEYPAPDNTVGKTSYYNNDITATFTITEANFYSEDIVVKLSKDGAAAMEISPIWTDVSTDIHVGTYTIKAPQNHTNDGDYIFTVTYTDRSKNEMKEYTSNVLVVDTINPTIHFNYMDYSHKETPQTATITITEHNFRRSDIEVVTNAKTITDKTVKAKDLQEYLRNCTWTSVGDVHTATISPEFIDAVYELTINYKDLTLNAAEQLQTSSFIVDRTAPEKETMSITYSESLKDVILSAITFGYYNPTVTVTFTAYDITSGVDYFTWEYTREDGVSISNVEKYVPVQLTAVQDVTDKDKFTASVTLPKEEAEQLRGKIAFTATDKFANESVKLTDENHVIVVDTISPTMTVEYNTPDHIVGENSYYNNDITATFTVTEANFYSEDMVVKLSKDGAEAVEVTPTWKDTSTDIHVGTYTIKAPENHSNDGDYIFTVTYTDRSNNEMKAYTSKVLVIDTTTPIIDFSYADFSNTESPQTATITITEHNFRKSDIEVVTNTKDITGKTVVTSDLQEYLRNCEWNSNGDVHTATISDQFADAMYVLTFNYKDLTLNPAKQVVTDTFTVDHTAPAIETMSVSYSKSLLDTVLETVTLGFYNPEVTITFTAYDITSGVDYFTWNYTRQAEASINNVEHYLDTRLTAVQDSSDKTKFTASVTLPKEQAQQLRGNIAFTATDKYTNVSPMLTDDHYVIVVDTISPTMTVGYTTPDNTLDNKSYYNNSVTATFTVTESNFYSEDVVVKLTKNREASMEITPTWIDISKDIHVGTYTIEAPLDHTNDGDYVFTVEYIDRSNNTMATYTSDILVVDTTLPVINVDYSNKSPVNMLPDSEGNNREYFAGSQTATVTIVERNFNPSEVEYTIIAKDVAGNALNAEALHAKSSWAAEGDNNILTITYPGDANYTFDIAYIDLALHEAMDYEADYFTVDNTQPTGFTFSYSISVLDTILSNISFGFYNAQMTVTLTASDDISKVNSFKYSYLNAEGVSPVNAQLTEEIIEESAIIYSDGGSTATVTFDIPKSALGANNQFNGTVSFDATDRAGNISEYWEDTKRIVVDSIAPTAEVQYNSPVQTVNGISYYDGEINATITINEANFYSEDVVVSVTKDNATSVVTPAWSDNSTDVHTGTFTLTGDGEYSVEITYADKSSNSMQQYISEPMIIDTEITEPTIAVNGEDADGKAFKDEVVLGVNFEDTNFENYEIKLTRTRYGAKNIDVTEQFIKGNVSVNATGGSGIFETFEKIPENDGIYTMTISFMDKAGHVSEKTIVFTVNRYGSVYEYSDYLVSLIVNGGAYVKTIANDLVITEYNADRLVDNSLNIEISRDGKPLDISEYTVTPEINDTVATGSSGWYQYQYIIDKNNFTADGIYKISVSSKDATGNTPENTNYEDKAILFRVDSTPPEIGSITGLEESIVNATNVEVTYTIYDTIGLESVLVYVNGKESANITDFAGDINNYSGSLTLSENAEAQTVRLVARDLAGNITDTASESFTSAYVFHDSVTVSTNMLVRLLANETLIRNSIAGFGVGLAGIILIILAKRKKKDKEEASS